MSTSREQWPTSCGVSLLLEKQPTTWKKYIDTELYVVSMHWGFSDIEEYTGIRHTPQTGGVHVAVMLFHDNFK